MVTFKDLRKGDHIYEISSGRNKIWDNKIEKIVRRTELYEFSCLDQDGMTYLLYIPNSEMNTSIYQKYNTYCTSLQDLLKIIIDGDI